MSTPSFDAPLLVDTARRGVDDAIEWLEANFPRMVAMNGSVAALHRKLRDARGALRLLKVQQDEADIDMKPPDV